MAFTERRQLRVVGLICTAAVLTGITAAVAADRIAIQPAKASATLGWCTHYDFPYGQFSSTSAWESRFCYDHYWHFGYGFTTTGVAIRDSNTISFNSGPWNWIMFYTNADGSYNCCLHGALYSTYGATGPSDGYAKARCDPEDDLHGFSHYCTTFW
jgi:hypothetical protein